jgi:type IV pilus assembly protein PilC
MEFKYKAQNQGGGIVDGIIDAPSEEEAVKILQTKGFVVVSITLQGKSLRDIDVNEYLSRVKNKDIVIFTRQLSTLVDADMPLVEGLRTLAKQVEKPALRKVIGQVSETVEAGSSLSAALAQHPDLFSSFYVKLVQSGEITGKLHDTLLYLADYMERSQAINSKIRGALSYPAFILFAMVVVTGIIIVYVLPQLLSIFKEAGAVELPITTKGLIWFTDFFNAYLIQILITLIVLVIGTWRFSRTANGKIFFDNAKINIPALGQVARKIYLARIAESMSTLIKSGIPILDALKIAADLVGNENYRNIINAAEDNVRSGGTISEIMFEHQEIPPLMASMIAVGEKTGKLDFMLDHVAKFYKSESYETIQNISALIEPILVLILGAGVAILVSSVLLPIYGMVGAG